MRFLFTLWIGIITEASGEEVKWPSPMGGKVPGRSLRWKDKGVMKDGLDGLTEGKDDREGGWTNEAGWEDKAGWKDKEGWKDKGMWEDEEPGATTHKQTSDSTQKKRIGGFGVPTTSLLLPISLTPQMSRRSSSNYRNHDVVDQGRAMDEGETKGSEEFFWNQQENAVDWMTEELDHGTDRLDTKKRIDDGVVTDYDENVASSMKKNKLKLPSEIKRSRRMQPSSRDTKYWLDYPCGVLPDQTIEVISLNAQWKAISDPTFDNARGTVTLFKTGSQGWENQTELQGESQGDCYGRGLTVSNSGDLFVGAPTYNSTDTDANGIVYAYMSTDRSKYTTIKTVNDMELFGFELGLSPYGKYLAVAAPEFDSDRRGAVHIFETDPYHPSKDESLHGIKLATIEGDVSDGVLGFGLFGYYGVSMNDMDYGKLQLNITSSETGAIHFYRTMPACDNACVDKHATCSNIGASDALEDDNGQWYQCICPKEYSTDAILIGDEGTFCRLPTLNETCEFMSAQCEYGYTCDPNDKTCRIPYQHEPCKDVQDYGCVRGFICRLEDVCRLPRFGEVCEADIGCHEGYLCDDDGSCRLPVEFESCVTDVGCFGTYRCAEQDNGGNICLKPIIDQACEPQVGCYEDYQCEGNSICRLPVEKESCMINKICLEPYQCGDDDECRKPIEREPCTHDIGCNETYVCGHDDICRIPTLDEECDAIIRCESGYLCDEHGLCRYPVETEACVPQVGCFETYRCIEDANAITLCQKPAWKQICIPQVGCFEDFKCGQDAKCRLPVESETCEHKQICEKPYHCGNDDKCRKPIELEPCTQDIGCDGSHVCWGGLCRRPIESEPCELQIGCNSTFFCDLNQNIPSCRKPVLTELCDHIIGCNATYQCDAESLECRKPLVGELCAIGPGPGCAEGIICEEEHCRLPRAGEECIETPGCFNTLTCSNETCIKPQENQTCVKEVGCSGKFVCGYDNLCRKPVLGESCDEVECSDTYKCEGGRCRHPNVGEACNLPIGCFETLVCEDDLCRLPQTDETCLGNVGCAHTLTCRENKCQLPQVNDNCTEVFGCSDTLWCMESQCHLPVANERCNSIYGCADTLTCKNLICRLPRKEERCSTQHGCYFPFICGTNNKCRLPMNGEDCILDVNCMEGYLCDNSTGTGFQCRFPRIREHCLTSVNCETGWVCDDSNVCRVPTEREACTENIGCAKNSQLCYQGNCTRLKYTGEECEGNAVCRGGASCDDGICSGVSSTSGGQTDSQRHLSLISFQDVTSEEYGTGQDGGGGIMIYDDGATIKLEGNVWKSYRYNYRVTRLTKIKFTFTVEEEAEGHAICVDEDLDEDTFSSLQVRCIALGGMQVGTGDDDADANSESLWDDVMKLSDDEVSVNGNIYEVAISKLFHYRQTDINYIALIQDNDSDRTKGKSTFSNIEIFEDSGSISYPNTNGTVSLKTLMWKKVDTKISDDIYEQFYLKDRVAMTATDDYAPDTDVSDQNAAFDDGFNLHGISKIEYWQDHNVRAIKAHYRNGISWPHGELSNNHGLFTLEHDEDINKIKVLNGDTDARFGESGPEYINFHTNENNEYKLTGDDSWADTDVKISTLSAPFENGPYILAGLTGLVEINYALQGNDLITIGTNWIQKTEIDGSIFPAQHEKESCPKEKQCVIYSYSANKQWKVAYTPISVVHLLEKQNGTWQLKCFLQIEKEVVSLDVSDIGRYVIYNSHTKKAKVYSSDSIPRMPCVEDYELSIASGSNSSKVRISSDGLIVAVSSPNSASDVGEVDIYSNQNLVKNIPGEEIGEMLGYQLAISKDGLRVGFSSPYFNNRKGRIQVVELIDGQFDLVGNNTIVGPEKERKYGIKPFVVNSVDDSDYAEVYLKEIQGNITYRNIPSYCPCEDNGIANSDCFYKQQEYTCVCKLGFISAYGETQMLQDNTDICIPSLLSSGMMPSHFVWKIEQAIYSVSEDIHEQVELVRIAKGGEENNVKVEVSKNKILKENTTDGLYKITIQDLNPGLKYNATLLNAGTIFNPSISVVTPCSCNNTSKDVTGRPSDFKIWQANGHVLFSFKDQSYCEEAFSFTRSEVAEEFKKDVSKYGTSFTSNYFFSSKDDCGAEVEPGDQASDDLSASKLEVGKFYMYCVRAVASHYMAHPFDSSIKKLTSSDDTCAKHKVEWEASIEGKVTTEPNAGHLPIKGVNVEWYLYDSYTADHLQAPVDSGTCTTTDGGSFDISMKTYNSNFNNHDEYAVLVKFSKVSQAGNQMIVHKFMCNDGAKDCSSEGVLLRLKHLKFNEQLFVYDATSMPFRGALFIAHTGFTGNMNGCKLPGATVCVVDTHGQSSGHDTVILSGKVLDEHPLSSDFTKACAETDHNGNFNIPVVMESRIQLATISFHEHTFGITKNSNFIHLPIHIKEDQVYEGMNFHDVTRTDLYVDIAGGVCNRRLGLTEIQLGIAGCEWKTTHNQTSVQNVYDVPAHMIEAQIIDMWDIRQYNPPRVEDKLIQVLEVLSPPDFPLVHMVNLVDLASDMEYLNNAEDNAKKQKRNQNDSGEPSKINDDKMNSNEKKIKEEAENQSQKVRFQYDGDLKMNVQMIKLTKSEELSESCQENITDEWLEDQGIDSFYLVDEATLLQFTIDLKYELLEAIGEDYPQIFCDILTDKKLHIISQIGIDDNEGFEEWFEEQPANVQKLLERCAPGKDCFESIYHDKDENDEPLGGAHVKMLLVTGRPKIAGNHIKTVMFQVLGDDSVKHISGNFVQGLYEKGPGNSFAVPTHDPIMILHDPPGGLSYTSYTNMVTTFKAETQISETYMYSSFGMKLGFLSKVSSEVCTGIGVANCNEVVHQQADLDLISFSQDIGGLVEMNDKTSSYQYATTWSYKTSTDPKTAGYWSDVFVVPNLNIMFQKVTHVYWNETSCIGSMKDMISFALDNPGNAPAVSFYSRHHIMKIKLPELENARNFSQNKLRKMEDDEKICCDSDFCEVDEEYHSCNQEEIEAQRERLAALDEGINGWNKAMEVEKIEKDAARNVNDWFDLAGYHESGINSHPLSLSPATLLGEAVCLECEEREFSVDWDECRDYCCDVLCIGKSLCSETEIEDKDALDVFREQIKADLDKTAEFPIKLERIELKSAKCYSPYVSSVHVVAMILPVTMQDGDHNLEKTNRIQFSGGGAVYQLSMKKKMIDTLISKPEGGIGNVESTSNIGFLGVDLTFAAGVGTHFNLMPLDLKIIHTHKRTITESEDEGTQITINLGDPNKRDEFVVDMFADHRYGSVIFETVAGRSKCPHEENTLAIEDPRIEFASFAPQVVMPEDSIIFQLKLSNVGVGASTFQVFTNHQNNVGSLVISINGDTLKAPQTYSWLEENEEFLTTVAIQRGPLLYKYPPVDFRFYSACDVRQSSSVDLWNVVDDYGNKFLQFLQPCPRVEWAGDIKRNQGFLVNTQSIFKTKLRVTVFNPSFSSRTFKSHLLSNEDCTNCRLKEVKMFYRRIGLLTWRTAQAFITTNKQVDFTDTNVQETSYGYSSLWWDLSSVGEGLYEILARAQCDDPGTPDDFNSHNTKTFTGVIDKTSPKQFGSVLPLRDLILPGESMVIVFTEPISCDKPFSFDLWLKVEESSRVFTKDTNMHVICEGRRVEFAIDPTHVDLQELMGKKFSVLLGTDYTLDDNVQGKLMDVNENALAPSIVFEKTFADLNLDQASSSFTFTLEKSCEDDMVKTLADEIKIDIVSMIGVSAERIHLQDVNCMDEKDQVTALITITPPSSTTVRRLQMKKEAHAIDLFYGLRDKTKESKWHMLNFLDTEKINDAKYYPGLCSVSKMKLVPGNADRKLFETNPDLKSKEVEILSAAHSSTSEDDEIRGLELSYSHLLKEVHLLHKEGEKNEAEKKQEQANILFQQKEEFKALRARDEEEHVVVHAFMREHLEQEKEQQTRDKEEHEVVHAFMRKYKVQEKEHQIQNKEEHEMLRVLTVAVETILVVMAFMVLVLVLAVAMLFRMKSI